MALFAYNKTLAELPLAAGSPIKKLPASTALGSRGKGIDVTSALKGVDHAERLLLQAQVDAGHIEFEWSGPIEYQTWPLYVNLPGLPEELFTIHVSPAPAGDNANDGSEGRPVLTLQRAAELLPTSWKSRFARILVHGPVDMLDAVTSNLNLGRQGGSGTPIVIEMDITDGVLGTIAAPSTSTNIISSTPLVTRFGADISVVAGAPAGQVRLSGLSLAAIVPGDAGLTSLLIRRADSQGNNSSWAGIASVGAGGPHTVDIYNPQGVVGDAANGAIYWQESLLGRTLRMTSGATSNCAKMIRDHGLAAATALTLLARSAISNNWRFTVLDTLGQPKGFEFQVAAGFVPTPGFTTINISTLPATATATDVAAATLPVVLGAMKADWNVKASRASSTQIEFRQLIEGSAGNTAVTLAGGAMFPCPAFTGGVGDLRTTMILNAALTDGSGAQTAPAVADTFAIEQNVGWVNYGVGLTPQVIEGYGGSVGFKNCLFVNRGPQQLALRTMGLLAEGLMIRANGANVNLSTFNGLVAGTGTASSQWQNAGVNNPFEAVLRSGKGACMTDFTNSMVAQHSRMLGHWMFSNGVMAFQGMAFSNINSLYSERTTFNVRTGPFQIAGSSRMRGQRTPSPATGILNLGNATIDAAASLEISESDGHAIQAVGRSTGIITTVSGHGNAGNGLNVAQGSGVLATNATVTGNAGDMKVGNRASRSWGDFGAVAPIGSEVDVTGDGSFVRTTTTTAPGLTHLLSGGAVPTVTAGAGAGAAPTALTVAGDNVSGTVTLTTNAADIPAANDDIFTMSFSLPAFPAGTTPRLLWTPANDTAADLAYGVWRSRQSDTTNLRAKLRSGPVPLPAATAAIYAWNYHVMAK
jgi:hypothetical protein